MTPITASYTVLGADETLDRDITITAECEQFGDELLVIWTPESLATFHALGLSCDELVGCVEAIESAWYEAADEDCRQVRSAQARGDQAFFDRRSATAAE